MNALKGKNFLRDIPVVLTLLFLIQCYKQATYCDNKTPVQMVQEVAKNNIETFSLAASKAFLALTPENRIAPESLRKELPKKVISPLKIIDGLVAKLQTTTYLIEKDTLIDQRDKDDLKADIKITLSHLEHITHEFEKITQHNSSLQGSLQKDLNQKLFACAQKTEKILLKVYNELYGKSTTITASTSLHTCVEHITNLYNQLKNA